MAVRIESDHAKSIGDEMTFPEFLLESPVSHGAKLLYMLLYHHVTRRRAFDQERLGQKLRVSDRQVRNLAGELVRDGLMEIERRGQGNPNDYVLFIPSNDRKDDSAQEVQNISEGERNSDSGHEASDRNSNSGPSLEEKIEDISISSSAGKECPPTNQGKGRKPRTRKGGQVENWVGRFAEKFAKHAGSAPNFGQIGSLLKPIREAIGEEELWRRWSNFCETCDAQYLYPGYFSKNTAKWIPKGARSSQRLTPTPAQPNGAQQPASPPVDRYAGMTARERVLAKHADRIQR